MEAKDEDSVVYKKKTTDKKGTDGKKNEVRGESNQEKEEQIMVKNKEWEKAKKKENSQSKEGEKTNKERKFLIKHRKKKKCVERSLHLLKRLVLLS